jgi:3-oxoacyl-[acyl-carrier-protein] synthase-1
VTPFLLAHFTVTTCLGRGLAAHRAALERAASGLRHCDFETVRLDTWIGEVDGVDDVRLLLALARHDCRNNRLARLGLEADGFADEVRAASARYGRARVGVFLGTSTSGILQTELAYRRRDPDTGALPDDFIYRTTHNSFSLAGSCATNLAWKGRPSSCRRRAPRRPRCSPPPRA